MGILFNNKVLILFKKTLHESSRCVAKPKRRKPNKIWVNKGSEC